MDFEKRLEQAVARGQRTSAARQDAAADRALSEEERKRLHTQYRLDLSEHIERCLQQLPKHLPGFRYQALVGGGGWGATVSRDDWNPRSGDARSNLYSRLELAVRPQGAYPVIEITAKGTVRNKEVIQRQQHQRLSEIDLDSLRQSIDNWVVEFAELYSAGG